MTDFEEKRKMALQINPGTGAPGVAQESGSQKAAGPNGAPNQDAANQFADLLKQPAEQEPKKGSPMPPFGRPFQSTPRAEQTQNPAGQTTVGDTASTADQSPSASAQTALDGTTSPTDGAPTATPYQETAKQFTDLLKQPAEQEAKGASSMPSYGSPFQPASRSEQTQGAAMQTSLGATALPTDQAQSAAAQPSFGQPAPGAKPEGLPAAAAQTSPSSQQAQNPQVAGTPAQLAERSDDKKFGRVSGEMTGALSDSQLAAAAGFQGVTGLTSNSLEVKGPEATPQPSVDGEKINAMMNSVTKELGMRDLSQLKLGGEMTLKLDQGALPNTEVKVRFDGNEMVITVDSQTNDVNSFCTDNLALLQQSVSAGMAEDMKVRVEIRNPPTDQPNQRRDDQSGGQGGSGQQGQSGGSSGDQGQPERDDQEGARSL